MTEYKLNEHCAVEGETPALEVEGMPGRCRVISFPFAAYHCRSFAKTELYLVNLASSCGHHLGTASMYKEEEKLERFSPRKP